MVEDKISKLYMITGWACLAIGLYCKEFIVIACFLFALPLIIGLFIKDE